ncbi:MAG: hypothetical protein N3D85_07835 [Candidatus Bathyarchaeota archaeon]|nr:hypothetical protein [Candidatus Bathyarchaeota archaeon]
MLVRKALIVKPRNRDDADLGDVIALARSVGKQVLKTKENVRILWTCESPYGYVVIVEGCSQPSGCKVEEKDHE